MSEPISPTLSTTRRRPGAARISVDGPEHSDRNDRNGARFPDGSIPLRRGRHDEALARLHEAIALKAGRSAGSERRRNCVTAGLRRGCSGSHDEAALASREARRRRTGRRGLRDGVGGAPEADTRRGDRSSPRPLSAVGGQSPWNLTFVADLVGRADSTTSTTGALAPSPTAASLHPGRWRFVLRASRSRRVNRTKASKRLDFSRRSATSRRQATSEPTRRKQRRASWTLQCSGRRSHGGSRTRCWIEDQDRVIDSSSGSARSQVRRSGARSWPCSASC